MKKITLILTAIFFLPLSLAAVDFGIVVDQSGGFTGIGGDAAGDYQANIIPRFSGLLGDPYSKNFADFIITAGFTVGTQDGFFYIPELLRAELSWHFDTAKISLGRMQYSFPADYIANGLFDGLNFTYGGPAGIFNAGVWYTGLLYKKNANIIMTEEELESYNSVVDYGDFAGTYFASRRMVFAAGWEHPALADFLRAKLAVIGQIDLNDTDARLHSQYVAARVGIPAGQFMFELGGVLQLMQALAETGDDFNIGLAGDIGVFWTLPVFFPSRLSFTGHFFGSRTESGSLAAFVPITAKLCGNILEANPSGISALDLGYSARFHKTLSVNVTSSYFIRNDLATFKSYPIDVKDNKGFFLGNEFFARLIWGPVSDLQITFGSGVFIPSMGNAAPDREPLWKIKLAVVAAVF